MEQDQTQAPEFRVGDIVQKVAPLGWEGVVVSVTDGGYVDVRTEGTVFSYWPNELVHTGEKIDPEKLEIVLDLFTSIDTAQRAVYRLNNLRDRIVAESRVPVGEA
jgi:hypothetical protein